MSWKETGDRHDQLLRELNEERAVALVRISRTLESLIDQMSAARGMLSTVGAEQRAREIAAYEELRQKALLYRWYLEVQREACGMRHHQRLDEFYRIPEPIERLTLRS